MLGLAIYNGVILDVHFPLVRSDVRSDMHFPLVRSERPPAERLHQLVATPSPYLPTSSLRLCTRSCWGRARHSLTWQRRSPLSRAACSSFWTLRATWRGPSAGRNNGEGVV